MNKGALSTKDLCMISLWTAVIAVMAQIAIPMPMGVPMTMQTFAITLAAIVLGAKRGAIATSIYVLLGAVGIPVFANFTGGVHIIVGATGGFIISFPIMAYIIGKGVEYRGGIKGVFIVAIIMGMIINYIIGVFVFCLITGSSIMAGITACVIPFIPTSVIKGVVGGIIGVKIRDRVVRLV